jgi:hypothetical protein
MTKIKDETPVANKPEGAAAEIAKVPAEAAKPKADQAKDEPVAKAEDDHARALDACVAAHAEVFPAHEEQPQEGGSFIRMPDGTLVREEEA